MSVFRKQTSRKGNVVYESSTKSSPVMMFVISEQDQFQQHLNKFAERFTEYDELFDEFRQEQKLSIVMLKKKMNNMKSSSRQSHRASHRFSKIKIPIVEVLETPEANKNYTLLKFDSIQSQSQSQESIEVKGAAKKQQEQPCFSLQQYEQVKDSIQSVRQELTEMKDKINFLSAYTSSFSNQENTKSKQDSLKKEITENLENELKSKMQKEIQAQMIETQKVFMQQINNLAFQFSDQIASSVDTKFLKISSEIQKIDQILFTHQEADSLKEQFKKDVKKFATQCMQIFSNKQDTKRSLNLLDRKVKILETTIKEALNKTEQEKQQFDGLKTAFQVSSVNNHHVNKHISLHKQSKSLSQMIKNKNHSSSMTFEEDSKQNISGKTYRKRYELSQGTFFTSKVSKQFMKNFGTNQKKLMKTNFQIKKQSNQNDKSQEGEKILRPLTALRQSMESF